MLERQIARGEMPPQVDRRRTLGEALDLWLRQYKRRSKDIYRARVDRYILPRIGTVPLVQVNATMIEELQDALLSGGLEPATVNAAIRPLSSAFTYFVKVKRWVRENPCQLVAELELKPRSYNWIKSRDEQEKLLAACKEPLRTMVAVLLMTGMRLSEMTHLHHSDVDLNLRLITIQRGKGGTTKSGKMRQVPINNALLPVLKAWRLRAGGDVLVFPGRGGKHGDVRTRRPCVSRSRRRCAGPSSTPASASTTAAHVRESLPPRGREHLPAEPVPRAQLGQDHRAGLRAHGPGRLRAGLGSQLPPRRRTGGQGHPPRRGRQTETGDGPARGRAEGA